MEDSDTMDSGEEEENKEGMCARGRASWERGRSEGGGREGQHANMLCSPRSRRRLCTSHPRSVLWEGFCLNALAGKSRQM